VDGRAVSLQQTCLRACAAADARVTARSTGRIGRILPLPMLHPTLSFSTAYLAAVPAASAPAFATALHSKSTSAAYAHAHAQGTRPDSSAINQVRATVRFHPDDLTRGLKHEDIGLQALLPLLPRSVSFQPHTCAERYPVYCVGYGSRVPFERERPRSDSVSVSVVPSLDMK
jgi:hypothetical protein